MSLEVAAVAAQIVAILQESPNKTLLGSKLSVVLKSRCPEFKPTDYESRTLREFLRTHVPQVYESARQGLDFIYSLAPVPGAPAQDAIVEAITAAEPSGWKQAAAGRLDDALWKTFVSPSSPYRLFVNGPNAEFRVVGIREEAPPSPWVQVPRCSASRHRGIAEDFVASLAPGEAKTRLGQRLSEKIWWIPFFDETRLLGVEKQWLEFRRAALFDELGKTLSSLGVSLTKVGELRQGQEGSGPGKRLPRESVRFGNAAQLRHLALSVVGRLDESELRELRFRLGDVLDALSGK